MEFAREKQPSEPHVLIFPLPFQGHVNTMLRLADALSTAGSDAGLRVTFLNSDHNHGLLCSFSSSHARLSRRPLFRFLSIPDGLPDDNPRSLPHFLELMHSLRTRSVEPYREVLRGAENEGWPPVTCVVADGFIPFAADVAQELGIPAIAFRTVSAASVWATLRIPQLVAAGEIPFPEKADLDEPIQSVPAMESYLRRRDLPSMLRDTSAVGKQYLHLIELANSSCKLARGGLILNTSENLEGPILAHIRPLFPATYAVGPLHSLVAAISSCAASASLQPEDHSAIAWLDAQPDRSVVYVSFGSIARLSPAEFLEFWHGFVDSGHRFLWVMRKDLVDGWEKPAAKEEERVRMVSWAPQENVLRHRAVGCFLTHSGWNSTLEGAAAGVPMACWPMLADQQINSRLVSELWQVGLDMKDVCRREVVERTVRAVMEGETGESLRRAAVEVAEEIGKSVETGGSSRMDFERLVRDILQMGNSLAEKAKI